MGTRVSGRRAGCQPSKGAWKEPLSEQRAAGRGLPSGSPVLGSSLRHRPGEREQPGGSSGHESRPRP